MIVLAGTGKAAVGAGGFSIPFIGGTLPRERSYSRARNTIDTRICCTSNHLCGVF
jgi:hypothetical protein